MKTATETTRASVVFVTAGSEEQAESIARALVGERLAACANIVSPIKSIYRWKDEVETDIEHLLIIKTRAKLVAKVAARVKELHSYEVPEIIAVPIIVGAKSYLDWVIGSTIAPATASQSGQATRKPRRKK